jgi:hypothetical protein
MAPVQDDAKRLSWPSMQRIEDGQVRTPPQVIRFVNFDETHSGTGRGDRRWVIRPHLTGWRLEFRDPGDVTATYAGTHNTLKAAKAEACR